MGSTYRTNLKKLGNQQKNAFRIAHNKAKFEHTKGLFKLTNVLNLYKLNILSTAVFKHGVHTKTSPPVFSSLISHPYFTKLKVKTN